ncbi:MAG TPA: D-2-hydroxyacid dehydrogenase [Eoetvoesiella sp.]
MLENKAIRLLGSSTFFDACGERIKALASDANRIIEPVLAPAHPSDSLTASALSTIDIAFYSRDIWLGSTMSVPSPASKAFFSTVDAAPNLHWLHVTSAGSDLAVYRPTLARGICLTTSSGASAKPIAQTAVAAILAQSRAFPHWLAAQAQRNWAPLSGSQIPKSLDEQTALIVGLGPIGQEIGRLLHTVGLRTVGVRRSIEAMPFFDSVHSYSELSSLLGQCDWLVLACPLTPETCDLIDAQRISLLPLGASIVNVSRGELLDEKALLSALRNGQLAGAYLDVFRTEPLPQDSELWDTPNVWITPHNSATSSGYQERIIEIFIGNLANWINKKPLANQVKLNVA